MRFRHSWVLSVAFGCMVLGAEATSSQLMAQTKATTPEAAVTKPAEAAKPADVAKPADIAKPADAAKPADVAKPADAAKPVDPNAADMEGEDAVSLGEIPDVVTEELVPERARKAIDGFVLLQDKYQDSPLEDYTDLQEFVDKDPKGPELDKDIKALGFKSVLDWNIAVTSVSVAYNNILDDQTADLKQQIEDVKASKDLAQDMKDRTIKSLQNSIPSENNTKIVQAIINDKDYKEKIKMLESTEE